MKAFRQMTGVAIAPHGKTSMSPELYARQLADGAWGITVATVQQLRVCREQGISRVVLANQLVGRQAIGYVLDELARDRHFEFCCLVDSVAGRRPAGRCRAGAQRRTPARRAARMRRARRAHRLPYASSDALAVARARREARPWLRLIGVEGFEGAIHGATRARDRGSGSRRFVAFIGRRRAGVQRREAYRGRHGIILLTAGGSAYFDIVTGCRASSTAASAARC